MLTSAGPTMASTVVGILSPINVQRPSSSRSTVKMAAHCIRSAILTIALAYGGKASIIKDDD